MSEEPDEKIVGELRSLAAHSATLRDLYECVKKIPDLIQLVPAEDFASYLKGLDRARDRKGYGDLRSSDAPDPVPYGRTSKDGLFYAYAFTSSGTAHKFAVAEGIAKEGGAYPSLVASTSSVLHSTLLRKYGGLILDEGSDHRLVLSRSTTAALYAQLTAEALAGQPEIYVLFRKGGPALGTTEDKKVVAYCFDSRHTADAGLLALRNAAGQAGDSLTVEPRPTSDAFSAVAGADFIYFNKGLPDERSYSGNDIARLLSLLKGTEKSRPEDGPARRGKYDSPPPKGVVLIPGKEAPFLQMWGGLPDVAQLFLPLDRSQTPEGRCVVKAGNMLEVANLLNTTPEGMHVGLVFTDRRLFVPGACYAAMRTPDCLKQYFHAGRVGAVAFNSSLNCADMDSLQEDITYRLPEGYTLYRFVLPRLVGLVTSDDPFAEKSGNHIQCAREAVSANDPFIAYHHAAAAREEGAELDDFYFLELDSLMALNLNEQVADYLPWYQQKGGKDPRFKLYCARALSLSGQPDKAFPLVQPLLHDRALGGLAWLERGRAHAVKGNFQEAIVSFDECLRRDPENLDAKLGAGIAYRNINYASGNRKGLEMARSYFDKVASVNGYRASEAYFHIGTILLALGDFAGCEDAVRKSLALRDTGIARRNLVLSLHALGKVKEAHDEYLFLSSYSPSDAQGLEKYFS